MGLYAYQGRDAAGKRAEGYVEAASPKEARRRLSESGTVAERLSEPDFRTTAGIEWRSRFFNGLGMLLKSGFPIDEALDFLAGEQEGEGRGAVLAVKGRVVAGGSLLSAVSAVSGGLPPFEQAVLDVAEQTGMQGDILVRLSGFLDSARAVREKIRSSLTYPCVILVLAVLLGGNLRLQSNHLVQATQLHLFGHVVGQMLGGVGAWPLAVLEHKGGIVTHLAHEAQRELVVFLGFRVIAHKDVGGDAASRNDAANGFHTPQIPLACVFSVHQLQYAVGTALHGQMDVGADVGRFGNDVKRLVAHILWMRGGETDAHFWCLSGHKAQQLGEVDGCLRLTLVCGPVGIDILPEQGHLFVTSVAQIAHLF